MTSSLPNECGMRSNPRNRLVRPATGVGAEKSNFVQDSVSSKSALFHSTLNEGPPSRSPVCPSHENVAVALLQFCEVLSKVPSRIPCGTGLGVGVRDPIVEENLLDVHGVESL